MIIALGTNGNFNSATGQKLIDYLGPDRTIYWIDAYGRDLPVQKDVNQTIRRVAAANQNVHVICGQRKVESIRGWSIRTHSLKHYRSKEICPLHQKKSDHRIRFPYKPLIRKTTSFCGTDTVTAQQCKGSEGRLPDNRISRTAQASSESSYRTSRRSA